MHSDFNLENFILHHTTDSHQWQYLPFLPPIPLPAYLSLHSLMLVFAGILLIGVFVFGYNKNNRVPTGMTNCLEVFVVFVRDEVAIANLGQEDGKKLTPFLCTLFFFILTLNLLGIIPAFSAATANISVTAALSLIILFLLIIGTIFKNGIKGFIHAILPHGVPFPVNMLVMVIEFFGIFIKCFALTLRLFANILAGHIVIFSLLGLLIIIGYIALPAMVLTLGIYMLELFVAFLQAYIFTLLSAMFMGLMYHPQH